MALVFKDFLHKTLIKSYEECMCAISINTNGFTGEWRVTPGFTTPAQKPLASQKTTDVRRSIKDRGDTQRYFSGAFQKTLGGNVCRLQRDWYRGRFGSRLGAGSQDPAVHKSSQQQLTPTMKTAVEEPTQSVKSLPALGQWYAHVLLCTHFVMQEWWPSLKISCYG